MRLREPAVEPRGPKPMDERLRQKIAELHAAANEAGESTYADPVTGYSVFTADFLRSMGSCCDRGCRHCPWAEDGDEGDSSLSA